MEVSVLSKLTSKWAHECKFRTVTVYSRAVEHQGGHLPNILNTVFMLQIQFTHFLCSNPSVRLQACNLNFFLSIKLITEVMSLKLIIIFISGRGLILIKIRSSFVLVVSYLSTSSLSEAEVLISFWMI